MPFDSTPQPFDAAARAYDRDFTRTIIGGWLRGRVHARLDRLFRAGDRVLELGCGTGEDALHLADRGVRVTATDASAAMLDATRAKAGDHPLIQVARLDLLALPAGAFPGPFDGAFASFGPLNCLDDWRPLAAWLAARITPGSAVAFGVMGPLCAWEIAWHGLHGDFRTALRRFRRDTAYQPDGGEAVPIRYPAPGRLRRDFAPSFRQAHLGGLGVFLPPSDAYGVIERRPRLLRLLTMLDARLARVRPFAWLGDHYWVEFIRQAG